MNPWPLHCERSALPTELHPQGRPDSSGKPAERSGRADPVALIAPCRRTGLVPLHLRQLVAVCGQTHGREDEQVDEEVALRGEGNESRPSRGQDEGHEDVLTTLTDTDRTPCSAGRVVSVMAARGSASGPRRIDSRTGLSTSRGRRQRTSHRSHRCGSPHRSRALKSRQLSTEVDDG